MVQYKRRPRFLLFKFVVQQRFEMRENNDINASEIPIKRGPAWL